MQRRVVLAGLSGLSVLPAPAALAQPRPPAAPAAGASAPPLRLLQLLDTAAAQQEHVRDYSAGLQAALQSAKRAGGIAGREVQVQPMDCDGSPAALRAVLERLRADSGLLGLAGTTSERLSLACTTALAEAGLALPHIAPWLPDARHDERPELVNIFASREQQLRHTLASLEAMGLRQLGIVYDGAATRAVVQRDLDATLQRLALKVPHWTAPEAGGIEALVRALPADAPPVLAFAGGAIELARLVQSLAARPLSRFVVSLADVDLGLLGQLGGNRALPLVLTQVVPNPSRHSVPFVRQYRELHAQLYDEAPTPSGLAGWLAGRYLLRLLEPVAAAPSRAALLEQLRRRSDTDLDGYRLRFAPGSNRGSRYVTQTLLGRDGRLIG